MGTRRDCIQVRAADSTQLRSPRGEAADVLEGGDWHASHVGDHRAPLFVVFDGVALWRRASAHPRTSIVPQEVPDDFVVDLHERRFEGPFPALETHLLRRAENLPEGTRNQAPRARFTPTL